MNPTAALRRLAWARAGLGVLFLLRTTPLLAPLHLRYLDGTSPLLGWPERGWTLAAFGLLLPAIVVKTLCIVRTIAAIAFTLGVRARIAGVCAATSAYLVLAQDAFGFIFTLHVLFMGTLVLALVDSSTTFALRPVAPRAPRSSQWLVFAFIASVYAWAALAKLRSDWLDGRTLALFHDDGLLDSGLADRVLASPGRRKAVAWIVALGELALGPLLLIPRTRVVGLVAAYLAHLAFEAAAHPDLFGWEMGVLLVCFWPARENP